jgi:hypothetical protein
MCVPHNGPGASQTLLEIVPQSLSEALERVDAQQTERGLVPVRDASPDAKHYEIGASAAALMPAPMPAPCIEPLVQPSPPSPTGDGPFFLSCNG